MSDKKRNIPRSLRDLRPALGMSELPPGITPELLPEGLTIEDFLELLSGRIPDGMSADEMNELMSKISPGDTVEYDIGLRLKEEMALKKMTITCLAERTGLSEDTIKAIRSGKTKSPGIHAMIAICDALGCTMDGFLHRKSLSFEEMELLRKYRTLNRHSRQIVLLATDVESHIQRKIDEGVTDTKDIPVFTSTRGRDVATDLISSGTEYISLPADYYTEADFGYKLGTNMLHPVYFRNDILAVTRRFPRNGELALFLIDSGTEMVRRYIENGKEMLLQSISSYEEDYIFTENIICLGTILGTIRIEDANVNPFLTKNLE